MSLVREEFSLRIGAFAVVVPARRQPRARRLGVRRHRRGDGDLRRLPLHLGADRDGGHPRRRRCSAPTGGPSGSSSLLSLVFLAYPIAMIARRPRLGQGREEHPDRPTSSAARSSCSSRWRSSAPRSRRTCSCTRRPRSPTAASVPTSTRTSGSTRSSASLFAGFIFAVDPHRDRGRASAAPVSRSARRPRRRRRWSRSPGAGAETLFAVGLLGASLLAAAIVPLSTAYGLAEAVGAERSVSRRFREAPLFLGLFTAQIVIGAARRADPGEPDRPADQRCRSSTGSSRRSSSIFLLHPDQPPERGRRRR